MYLQATGKLILWSVLLLFLSGTMGMVQPQLHPPADPPHRPMKNRAVLTVAPQLVMHSGESLHFPVHLMIPRGEAIPAAEIIFTFDNQDVRLFTDANGLVNYPLPAQLAIGRYPIKIVFGGAPNVSAAIAMTELHVLPALSSSVGNSGEAVAAINQSGMNTLVNITRSTLMRFSQRLLRGERDLQKKSADLLSLSNPSLPTAAIAATPADEPASHRLGSHAVALAVTTPVAPRNPVNLGQAYTPGTARTLPTVKQAEDQLSFGQGMGLITRLGAVAGTYPGALVLTALGSLLLLGLVLRPSLVTKNHASIQAMPLHNPVWWRLPIRRQRFLARFRNWEIPRPLWYGLRIASVGIALGLSMVLWVRPAMGLFLFWRVLIPTLPLLFFIAPGLWRNICPMAALNQTPRLFGFTQALILPKWMQEYGYMVAISLFLVLVTSRKWLFNHNGPALSILILLALAAAFVMGNFFKGKSGWCSSICPLLPIQRIYGQTPFVNVTNTHCQPCVGCTKNCYDLNPKNAYLADLYDEDRNFAAYRKFFVGLFPGFILAFYSLPDFPATAMGPMYSLFALYGLVSLGSFFLIDSLVKVKSNQLTVLYGAVALNLYYWFNAPTLGALVPVSAALPVVWGLRLLVLGLTLIWMHRTYQKEKAYIELVVAPRSMFVGAPALPNELAITEPTNGLTNQYPNHPTSQPTVTIEPDGLCLSTAPNRTLLDVIESNHLPIEVGCRMGLCGADPVCVMHGMENLSKISDEERTTLERLGLAPTTRMACMARVRGDVKIALSPQKPQVYMSSIVAGFTYDKAVKRVVIVGNGIAGVTAADHIRRRHPTCEIHLIGRERHHLYNRMGITRLIYGRSAMQGLYLLPDKWYDDFGITSWLNTHVAAVDPQTQQVTLGTGERLTYDRLILTTGSESYLPPIVGYGMAGTFVLRTAEDAMAIRAYVQAQGCRQAVVAGGGLLGLEAAYGLHKLGLTVTVLERSNALLRRQLDERAGQFLRDYLEGMGIHILMEAETVAVQGAPVPPNDAQNGHYAEPSLQQVILKDGQALPCDLLLVAAGIRSEVGLAQSMGLQLKRGVVVDAQMRTSDPYIYAAGDVAEFAGNVYGLWPVAVSQAEVAAANAVAAPEATLATYTETPPVTMLKVVGIDVTSIGRIDQQADDECVIALEESDTHRYRKLIVVAGKIVGAILLGYPLEAAGVAVAVKQQVDIAAHLDDLSAGDWQALIALA